MINSKIFSCLAELSLRCEPYVSQRCETLPMPKSGRENKKASSRGICVFCHFFVISLTIQPYCVMTSVLLGQRPWQVSFIVFL